MSLKRNIPCYLVVILCLGTASCFASLLRDYGAITPDLEVKRAFEGYQVNKELRYYISGSDLHPNALMGLRREYRLDSATLWREVEMSSTTMQKIIDGMKLKAAIHLMFPQGFVMRDNSGNLIGVWYSILSARTFLRLNDDGSVWINTPRLDTYENSERRGLFRGNFPPLPPD